MYVQCSSLCSEFKILFEQVTIFFRGNFCFSEEYLWSGINDVIYMATMILMILGETRISKKNNTLISSDISINNDKDMKNKN